MSSLIFHITPEIGLIATDTLIASNDKFPSMYATKAFALPHLRLLICGTGDLAFINQWIFTVNIGAIVRDIEHLNTFATQSLQESLIDMSKKYNTSIGSTTIYHFGFPANNNTLYAYAYRSTNNFKSEKLIYGIGVKPPVPIDKDLTLPDDLRSIMEAQRKQESEKQVQERLLIGGEIILHVIKSDNFQIFIHDRFDDYETDLKIIFEQCPKT
jgi:hypothetical protein